MVQTTFQTLSTNGQVILQEWQKETRKLFKVSYKIKHYRDLGQMVHLMHNVRFSVFKKIDVRRGSGPSAAADAKEIHMNMYIF